MDIAEPSEVVRIVQEPELERAGGKRAVGTAGRQIQIRATGEGERVRQATRDAIADDECACRVHDELCDAG